MKPKILKVSLISPPDRDLLCAEIMLEDEQIAELNQENGEFTLEIYPRRDGTPWKIGHEELLSALEEAKKRLSGN